MSDPTAQPESGGAPPPAPSPAPAPAPAAKRAEPALLPLGDEDRSILSHLGLPFYYRHSPGSATRRATFWISFFIILLIVFMNFLFFPYQEDSLMYRLRMLLFGGGHPHQSYDEGFQAIFYQLSVVSLILSCVLAPLFATFSFSSERVLGTMEFLRLSPMSTLSIVMGKMFAPAAQIHKISFVCLLLACAFGLLSGEKPQNLALAVLVVALSAATLHAIGALLANLSAAWRGFGAVGGLLGIGFFLSFLPAASWSERGYEFIAFLFPWSAFDGMFWQTFYSYRSQRYSNEARFFGVAGLVKVYVLAFHAIFFSLLVWASSRKLDDENQTALPKAAWFGLWAFLVFSAVGLAYNVSLARQAPLRGWEDAAGVTCITSLFVIVLALLDHPHRRELVLTQLCECLAGREKPPSALRQMAHTLFVSGMTALAAIAVITFVSIRGLPFNVTTSSLALYALIPVLVVFMAATAIESAFVGYSSRMGRVVACAIAWAVLGASMLAPIIHSAMVSSRFNRVMWAVSYEEQLKAQLLPKIQNTESQIATVKQQIEAIKAKPSSNNNKVQTSNLQNQLVQLEQTLSSYQQQLKWAPSQREYLRSDSGSAVYLADIKDAKDAQRLQQQYGNDTFALLWRYHAGTFIFYPIFFLGAVILLFLWRARIYRNLHKEAEQAVQPGAVA